MAAGSQPIRSDKPSIKFRCNPLEGEFFELVDLGREDCTPSSSDNTKHNGKKSEHKSAEILSTGDLISAVSQIWDYATHPFSVIQPKTSSKHKGGKLWRENVFCYPAGCRNDNSCNSAKAQYSVNSMNITHSSPMVKASVDHLKVTQKQPFFEHCNGSYMHSLLWRFLAGDVFNESWRCKGLASVSISADLETMYGWMSETTRSGLKHPVKSARINKKKTTDCCTGGDTSNSAICCHSCNTISPLNNSVTGSVNFHLKITKTMNSSSGQNENFTMNTRTSITSLYPDYYLGLVQIIEANNSAFGTPSSRLLVDGNINGLASGSLAFEESQNKMEEDDLHENKRDQQKEIVTEDKSKLDICLSTQDKPCYTLAKQEHAYAGAMAGIVVSLCLHPADTIKTVIQSCRTRQNSIHYIGRSIITERGVTGLYRGITSKIASSAPISAVYTFTYESVKGALLPILPKEYMSFAHCIAGGSASIATSVIFTPSERIKQQMQVGLHYQNCWNALIGIMRKGGLPSLYVGWGAVLCRNVPHSIIKFYTYESLKQWMLLPLQSTSQPNSLLPLVCGGLAGSTAALFTTPFDVVKTRLQTQIPGSTSHYNSVFNTLKEISKHEGLKGLYSGLTPRLVMYMTHGALFFVSYESFKRLFL